MNRNDLLKLDALAHLTPRELAERDPRLAKHVDRKLTERATKTLARRFEGAGAPVRRVAANLRVRPDDLRSGRPLGAVMRGLADRLRRRRGDGDGAETTAEVDLDAVLDTTDDERPLDELVGMDTPIAMHPEFRPQLEAAKLFKFADAFALDDAAVEPLIDAEVRLNQLDASRLEGLVAGQALDERTAKQVADAANAYRVLDENPDLVAAAKERLRTEQLDATKLVELDADGFTKIIRMGELEPPVGMDVEGWAEGLHRKTLNLFPTAGLAATLERAESDRDFAKFLKLNRNTELLTLDLASAEVVESIEFGGVDADTRTRWLDTAKSYQRVWAMTDDVLDTHKIVDAGYVSAVQVAGAKVERIAQDTGLKAEAVQRYWDKSRKIATTVTGYTGTIIDLLHGGFNDTAVSNISTEVDSYLAEIPGFDDLFGALAFCDCKDCHSILGPAAYFVDLMTFIDEQISQEHFTGALADHVLALKSRRPDLWTLELTCENTHELVPYLEIINEILENAVASDRGFDGDFADRPAVFEEVYAEALLGTPGQPRDSFEQPFHLPVEQLKIYLAHFERTLADAAHAVGAPMARASLGLSPDAYDVLVTPEDDLAALERWYGLDFDLDGDTISAFDAQDLVAATGLTRNELGRAVNSWYVSEAGSVAITIRGEKRSNESIQNDIERIRGLKPSSLDRLHRFTRLWRALGWTIEEVDLALERLDDEGLADDISTDACNALAAMLELRNTLDLDVDQTLALFSSMPRRAADEEGTPLFDRVFNTNFFVRTAGEWPEAGLSYLHPSLRPSSDDDVDDDADPNTGRLTAGLRTDEMSLGVLVRGLAVPLGVTPNADDVAARRFALDATNLGLLHRHALLTRCLGVSAEQLFALCALAPNLSQGWVAGLDDLLNLVSFWSWWEESGWTLDALTSLIAPDAEDDPREVLWADALFDEATVAFMENHPELFADADWGAPDVKTLMQFETFADHLAALDAQRREALLDALAAYDESTGFDEAARSLLAERFDTELDLIQSLHDHVALGADPIAALGRLEAALALCERLGVSGNALAAMASTNYEVLSGAAAALAGAMHTRYDQKDWDDTVQPLEDKLLARKRDALVDYLVHTGAPQFDEVDDLYHYYLLDVELGGCARTSRLVAATSSLQLYVQRCRLNLERSPAGAAQPVEVSPETVTDEEWAWRKNYRVWEANRKVFLYPENYAEPELRDNKSPLFEELEEELLAQEINADTVRDAYARYLKGFEEVSKLKIAGAWHEKAADGDVLHLFGATSADPPVYYYRRVENIEASVSDDAHAVHWSPWRKIDVQIPTRKVSPVVYRGRLHVFWVKYVTKTQTTVSDGDARFTGYRHTMSLEYTVRKLDGTWTSPQSVKLNQKPFGGYGPGVISDPVISDTSFRSPFYDDENHSEPREGYTLDGFAWERVYPWTPNDDLLLRGADFQMISGIDTYELDLRPPFLDDGGLGVPFVNPLAGLIALAFGADLSSRLVWSERAGGSRRLHMGEVELPLFEPNTLATLVVEKERLDQYTKNPAESAGPQWDDGLTDLLDGIFSGPEIARINGSVELTPVMGSASDVIIDRDGELFLLQEGARDDAKYHLRRLGTSVAEDMARVLFNDGVDALLDIDTQLDLGEHELPFRIESDHVVDATHAGELDYTGPMGLYLREVFFHIPFLIANHLNSQNQFEEAQAWYHHIFDPTASDKVGGLSGLDEQERERRERNRVWRYREFREIGLDSLRTQLTDEGAIGLYERDPFNPHAIARLRLSAYQKTILMKYVDNLLDWGDSHFGRFTMESLNEATLLYVTAQELLGKRPPVLGDCGELEDASRRTFDEIAPNLTGDFLAELETWTVNKYRRRLRTFDQRFAMVDVTATRRATEKAYTKYVDATVDEDVFDDKRALKADFVDTIALRKKSAHKADTAKAPTRDIQFRPRGKTQTNKSSQTASFGWSVTRQVNPVFCVPKNKKLLGYWDRVEDRLYKLRNCMTIDGVKKLPALFAPPIDPAMLVAARAAGLSLQDALDAVAGELPAYRFRYLVAKARQYVGGVQSFGAALMQAIEKRDAEELARIRRTHQKNVLDLTEALKEQEIEAADKNLATLQKRIDAATYRKEHYEALIDEGRLDSEVVQHSAKMTSAVLRGTTGVLETVGAIAYLVPQFGSPFAMKYGGKEAADSGTTWAEVTRAAAGVTDAIGAGAGLIASNTRREQGWEHQKELAQKELDTLGAQVESATLRKQIAQAGLELHRTTQEQLDEVIDFYEEKFSNLGLYTWLSSRLQALYREAYNTALSFVRMAEAAYHFERDDTTVFVDGAAWDASHAGLLAGEELMLALDKMEQRFIETDYRSLELNQSFSLAQIDPKALLGLKQDGRCEFHVPEFFFDLYYPGHYKRRIKAVRLSIPCITGPYTNVSARLELVSSQMRTHASLEADALVDVPATRTTSVATSTAQGDAGVFELNFRDERYMPFEGAGAVSTWRLELPRNFRPFDYNTINDVILNISYTAEDDGVLREEVEGQNAQAESALLDFMADNGLTRVISMRQEYSSAFHRLTHADAGTAVDFDISSKHFPLFLQGRDLQPTKVRLVVVPTPDADPTSLALRLDGNEASGFVADSALGELPTAETALAMPLKDTHTLELAAPGALARTSNAARIDPDLVEDVLLVIDYGL
ncbi:hypothetical protein FIV42_15610 [Persicimonas caeni]|uniref:Toxin n=1 Tax=Persicimonas caeni TaxID=2292766 RepID=A0A4Y6PUY5_PERCE|nr:neuraminidase-like domain-containing protein [Persicimonas caeni]QDG52118.1 hypothetical protein FIV42_15610 [Persicimonas caeni]QED33339.1 hypothetical protein FRD00_15605 [Persicimonas caeni]